MEGDEQMVGFKNATFKWLIRGDAKPSANQAIPTQPNFAMPRISHQQPTDEISQIKPECNLRT
jgi:hypothetical protein